MKYEFKGSSIREAVAKSVRKQQPPLSTKSTTTISAGINSYAYERVSVSEEQGERYSISWSADNPAD